MPEIIFVPVSRISILAFTNRNSAKEFVASDQVVFDSLAMASINFR
jgi:hypothetical protein